MLCAVVSDMAAIYSPDRRAQEGTRLPMDRRSFLKSVGGFAACSILTPSFAKRLLPRSDDSFLEDFSERSFRFFWEQSDPYTGLTRDRAARGRYGEESRNIGSIAATGFGLAALCIGASRNWIDPEQARNRVKNTLSFFALHAPNERGWFYHCMDIRTGQRSGYHKNDRQLSEVSSIDSALLMGGILASRQYFHDDAEIARLADTIYQRMDFRWMLNGHPLLLSQGWTAENGFIPHRWDSYCELTLLYLLGIGSPTFPLDPASWYAWNRNETIYADCRFIGNDPLFTHQFSHAFVDYRNRREQGGAGINWFDNSVAATHAHRRYCLGFAGEFPGYSEKVWGVTSSDSANGYVAWGGMPSQCPIDGTVVPCAAGGSLMFAPEICVPALRFMHNRFGEKIYGRYGFVDAFNPTNGWVDRDYVGIDVGIALLSAENLRSSSVWNWFMANPEARRGMDRAELMAA
jgi:hypothetical protein